MLISYKRSQTSIVLRVKIRNSSVATGAGLTGLTFSSTGMIISTIADNEATATAYTVAGSTIETITTLGTFAAPTATKCRFKEVDATNHKGVYEIQIADARFAVSSAKSLLVSISGAANAAECDVLIPLTDVDQYDAVRGGMTALPNVASGSAGAIITSGTGTAQLSVSSGLVTLAAVTHTGAVIPTVTTVTNQLTAAAIATGVWQDATAGDFTAASSIGKALYIANIAPGASGGHFISGSNAGTTTFGALTVTGATTLTGAISGTNASNDLRINGSVPGASGGLFIAGTNAATTVTTSFTTTFTGNLTGSVGSVTGAVGSVTGLTTATITTAVLTTAMTESYAADGVAPTLAQASFLTMQILSESNISGTTMTVKKLDGTTSAATFTLNSSSTPTTITRAT